MPTSIERFEALAHDLFVDLESERLSASGRSTTSSRRRSGRRRAPRGRDAALRLPDAGARPRAGHRRDRPRARRAGGPLRPAGPAGAPTRGMAHILPTGRNFYAVDPRALPSQAAWRVGQQLAREVLARHLAEEGRYPEMVGISAGARRRCARRATTSRRCWRCSASSRSGIRRSRRVQDLAVVPLDDWAGRAST